MRPSPVRAFALLLSLAVAQKVGGAEPPAPSPTQIEEAKRFFEQGESLRAAGQHQAALEAYLKSRALVPRASNTVNVAVCLYALKRYDEAYDYFEEALSKYPTTQLPTDARESAKKTMADIETKVGRLDVSANIDGTLVVDGRPRGKLPLTAPIRMMPGKHVVRILRDGFETFEQVVEVKVGATASIDATLKPLTSAGRLRVEGADLDGGTLIVDGATVGTIPWEGTLKPGTHVFQIYKGDTGTGPTLTNVIVGQTVTTTATAKPLGPERRIEVDPPTAELSIDGVAVGKGRYQGRLPIGARVVEAREIGYFTQKVTVNVTADDTSDFPVKLVVDAAHPHWGTGAKPSRFALEFTGGYGFASTTGGDAGSWCLKATYGCDQTAAPAGIRAGVVGVYELPSKLHVFVGAGWMQLARGMKRVFPTEPVTALPADTRWTQIDAILIRGPYAALGVGYRIALSDSVDLGLRFALGGAFVRVTDDLAGSSASSGGRTLATKTDGANVAATAVMFSANPELQLGIWAGSHVRINVGVVAPISLLNGPTMKLGDTHVNDPAIDCTKSPLDCAAGQKFDPSTNAYSRFVTFVPEIGVGYWF